MNHIIPKLILYRNLPDDGILRELCEIFRLAEQENIDRDVLAGRVLQQINRLLTVATDYGFDRNLWQNYLTFLLIPTRIRSVLPAKKSVRSREA